MRWKEREADDHAEFDAQAEQILQAQWRALAASPQGRGLMSDGEMEARWQQAWNDGVEAAAAGSPQGNRQGDIEAGA